MLFCSLYGLVAQLAEHQTENLGVGGSIPPQATINEKYIVNYRNEFFILCSLRPKNRMLPSFQE